MTLHPAGGTGRCGEVGLELVVENVLFPVMVSCNFDQLRSISVNGRRGKYGTNWLIIIRSEISFVLFISHLLIRYESSRGHKIDGTIPNQTGDTFGEKKQGKQIEA